MDVAVRIVADAIVVGLLVLLQANVMGLPEERLLLASVHGYRGRVRGAEAERQHLAHSNASPMVMVVRGWYVCDEC